MDVRPGSKRFDFVFNRYLTGIRTFGLQEG